MRKTLGVIFSLGFAVSLVLAGCGASGGGGGGTAAGGTGKAATGSSKGSGTAINCKAGTPIKVDSTFTMVCLAYNDIVFGANGAACAGVAQSPPCGFDQGGNTLDATDPVWPKQNTETTASGIKFWFPETGGGAKLMNDGLNVGPELGTSGITVPVPQGKYSELYLLAGAGNSNSSQLLDVQFNYTDGTKDGGIQQNIDDWCNTSPVGQPGFTPADRWSGAGASTSPGCGVFVYPIPVPGKTKQLKNIVFSFDGSDANNFEPEIIALTLKS